MRLPRSRARCSAGAFDRPRASLPGSSDPSMVTRGRPRANSSDASSAMGSEADAVMMTGSCSRGHRRPSPAARSFRPSRTSITEREGTSTFSVSATARTGRRGWSPMRRKAITIDGTDWLYSDRLFNDFRAELESTTAWRYSGGTDLVLTNATWDAAHRSTDLDFSSALAMNLEQAIADGAIPTRRVGSSASSSLLRAVAATIRPGGSVQARGSSLPGPACSTRSCRFSPEVSDQRPRNCPTSS